MFFQGVADFCREFFFAQGLHKEFRNTDRFRFFLRNGLTMPGA